MRRRRHQRVRSRIFGTSSRPRLSVFRSSKHIYAQLIDDTTAKTLVVASDYVKAESRKRDVGKAVKSDSAVSVGEALAKAALKAGVTEAVFDRGGFKYHGRVKALAEAARKAGLKF